MYRKYTAEAAARAAVSVRKREFPRWMGMNPAARACSASSVEKSPSGPIITVMSEPSYSSSTSLMLLLGMFSSSKQYAIRRRPSESLLCDMNSLTLTGSWTVGIFAFRDCLAALTRIFSTLAVFRIRLSECSPIIGVRASKPNSQAFSANHSYLSLFFVGQTARWRS